MIGMETPMTIVYRVYGSVQRVYPVEARAHPGRCDVMSEHAFLTDECWKCLQLDVGSGLERIVVDRKFWRHPTWMTSRRFQNKQLRGSRYNRARPTGVGGGYALIISFSSCVYPLTLDIKLILLYCL